MEMLLFYNNSSHSCKVQIFICQPTNLLFSCQSVESFTVQQHIMIMFNPLCLGEKKSIDLGYKIREAVADGFLMRQIKALGSSLLLNPLHSVKIILMPFSSPVLPSVAGFVWIKGMISSTQALWSWQIKLTAALTHPYLKQTRWGSFFTLGSLCFMLMAHIIIKLSHFGVGVRM